MTEPATEFNATLREERDALRARIAEATACGEVERVRLVMRAQAGVRAMLQLAGEDPEREGIQRTPERVVNAFLEMTGQHGADPGDVLSTTFEKDGYDQMVVQRSVPFTSLCEHHLLPFHGTADVGYIPSDRVVGLSKLSRLVDCYASRLQIQERMTAQIVDALVEHLRPIGAGVVIRAEHSCVACRGVRKSGTLMLTSALRGAMLSQSEVRSEFLRLAGL